MSDPQARLTGISTSDDNFVVGVDMGGTKILASVINVVGGIISQSKTATRADKGASEVIDRIVRCIRKAIGLAGLETSQIRAIGIGAPGPLDPETGVVIFAPNLGWSNVPLKSELEARMGISTFVDNDVNLCALGESAFGVGQGVKSVVGIFVGTGIGGGIILDGKLFHGASKTAGEVGHIIVKSNGPRCGCGNLGCLEAVASRTAITRQLRKAILKHGKTSILLKLNGGNLDLIRSSTLAKAVRRGDKLTTKVMRRTEKYLGIGVASIVNFLNPEMIVLGGGVIEAMGDDFLAGIRRVTEKHVLPSTMNGVQIVGAKLGDDAGVIGGAVLARQMLGETITSPVA
jgi:glucokinase